MHQQLIQSWEEGLMSFRIRAGKCVGLLLIRAEVTAGWGKHGTWGQAQLGPRISSAISSLCDFG